MGLIKLTDPEFKREVYFNPESIACFHASYTKDQQALVGTSILLQNGASCVVLESPEEVKKMMGDKIGLKDIYLAIENSNRNLRGYHG